MTTENAAKPTLTRIPLEKVSFTEAQDFPQGNSSQPGLIFTPQSHKGRQFFLGFFVPSFQVVEVEWYRDENAEPQVFRIPMPQVRSMKDAPRSKK